MSRYGWSPYVPVAKRREQARKKMEKLRKKGLEIKPVTIEGRTIARTFWGKGWCDHLESFSDYENRLPRGRTYVRNGSVCHLDVTPGKVTAMVSGSSMYTVTIEIKTLPKKKWNSVKKRCAGQIDSLIELLQGKLSASVMSVVTDRKAGLFPLPGEISLMCTCPDWAEMCKHVAATLYGVGARFDESPELLFLLRGVDYEELITVEPDAVADAGKKSSRKRISDDALADVFGIELSGDQAGVPTADQIDESPQPSKAKAKAVSKSTSPKTRVTGKSVAALRAKLGMSKGELARLMRVSPATITAWEKQTGVLSLHAKSAKAYASVRKLTKRQAWSKLE